MNSPAVLCQVGLSIDAMKMGCWRVARSAATSSRATRHVSSLTSPMQVQHALKRTGFQSLNRSLYCFQKQTA